MTTIDYATIFYHPLTMVILGATFGWLFVSFVWTPLKTKNDTKNKNNRYKKEVYQRLNELKASFEKSYSAQIIDDLLEGKTTLNPDFKHWRLGALIHSGWSDYVFRNTYTSVNGLENLIDENETALTAEKIRKGLLLIDTLNVYLKNINEN